MPSPLLKLCMSYLSSGTGKSISVQAEDKIQINSSLENEGKQSDPLTGRIVNQTEMTDTGYCPCLVLFVLRPGKEI